MKTRSQKYVRDPTAPTEAEIKHEGELSVSITHRQFDLFTCLVTKRRPLFPLNLVYEACRLGYPEYITYLLETGLASKKEISDFSYIHLACAFGHIDVVKLLVNSGANVRHDKDTLLVLVSSNGYIELAKYLIGEGCKPSSRDNESLVFACESGNLSMVRLLVANGADIYTKNGVLPMCCDELRHYDIVDYFIRQGVSRDSFSENARRYNEIMERSRTNAVNKIGTWWIPLCYDPNRDCGKRMMERSWERVERMYEERL